MEERRECRIARSPVVPSAVASAGFSPLYGKKKGVGGRQTRLEMCGDRLLYAARFGPLQGIALKAQKKNGSGRGRMLPEPTVMTNNARYILRRKYAEGVS